MSVEKSQFLESLIEDKPEGRPMHPKVLNVLRKLTVPSPGKVSSDCFQPKSGDLRSKVALTYLADVYNSAAKSQ